MATSPNIRVTKLIDQLAPIWQERMNLAHWDIDHIYLDSYFGDDGEDDYKVTAITECRWQYLQARIKWYLPSAVRHDDETLEKVLVHELCHVLLSPEQALVDTQIIHSSARNSYSTSEHDALAERNYEHIELATEMTTKAIMNGWKTP